MIKTEYKYNGEDLKLKSKNDKELDIVEGSLLTFYPEFNTQNQNDIYEILVSRKNKTFSFYGPTSLVTQLIENSTKYTNEIKEIFEIEVKPLLHPKVQKIIDYQKSLLDQLRNRDVAANAFDLMGDVGLVIEGLRPFVKTMNQQIDWNNLTDSQQLGLKKFEHFPVIKLPNKNIKIDQVPYKYLKTVEDFALNTLATAIGWLEEYNDPYMSHGTLNDVLDIMMVAKYINDGNLALAYDKMNRLDTYVREGFNGDLWEDFIHGYNKHTLLQAEADYSQIVHKNNPQKIKKLK